MTPFDIAIDSARVVQVTHDLEPQVQDGMAVVCEDTPIGKVVGITTTSFAKKFCADDPYYTWRKL